MLVACASGALAALMGSKLVLLDGALGSSKFDALSSIDLMALMSSYNFTTKMKTDAVALLESFEAWADKQASSMDMAQSVDKLGQNFESLLRVMDSLYQVSRHTSDQQTIGLIGIRPSVMYLNSSDLGMLSSISRLPGSQLLFSLWSIPLQTRQGAHSRQCAHFTLPCRSR